MNRNKTGQAMLELICGLVGVVVVITMLLQINLLSQEHLRVAVAARTLMGEELIDSSSYAGDGKFLSDWENGDDDYRYSEDDEAKTGSAGGFLASLMEGVAIDELEGYLAISGSYDGNRISDVIDSGNLVDAFDVTKVSVESDPVELLPGVRKLVYDVEELQFTHEIYMPWANNVMD
ncbi:hypothetical protein P4B35_20670 [Pontiellaceae bacterium B12227]|nr:hypothetical protein [Pontiellaceae bacterium B12227]